MANVQYQRYSFSAYVAGLLPGMENREMKVFSLWSVCKM